MRTSTIVQVQFAVGHVGNLLAQHFDVCAFLADDDTRTRGVDCDAALFVRTFNNHTADAGLLALVLDEIADLEIFQQQVTVILGVCIPAAVPGPVDAEPQPNGVNFLAH